MTTRKTLESERGLYVPEAQRDHARDLFSNPNAGTDLRAAGRQPAEGGRGLARDGVELGGLHQPNVDLHAAAVRRREEELQVVRRLRRDPRELRRVVGDAPGLQNLGAENSEVRDWPSQNGVFSFG